MIGKDKTREQLMAELAHARKRMADTGAGGAGGAGPSYDLHAGDALRAVHRSPSVTIVWRACDGWPVSFVSEGVRRFGYVPQDLIGLVHHERYIAADDLASFISAFVDAGEAHSSRSVLREYRLLTRSGEPRWIRERMWVERDDRGRATHFTGLLTDVDELRRLEAVVQEQSQRLAALFEYANQPILLHDLKGRCIDANLAACDYLGYSRDELLRVPLDALVSPEMAARAQRLAQGAAGSRDVVAESAFVGRDGSSLPVVVECRVIELSGEHAILTLMRHHPAGTSRPPESEDADALRLRIQEQEETTRALREERDRLAAAHDEDQDRLRAQEVLLRDVHHRVKNNLQVISSLLGLQAEHIDDQRALDAFAESQNRVRAMALVHERVYQSSDLARVDLAAYIRDLAERLFVALGADPAIALDLDAEPVSLPMDTAIPCGLLISELISNSIKHAFPAGRSGSVKVRLRQQEDRIVLTIADDGVGLPEGLDYRHTESLGLQLVTILAQQLDATVDVDGSVGTRFTIAFRDGV